MLLTAFCLFHSAYCPSEARYLRRDNLKINTSLKVLERVPIGVME